MNRSIDHQDRSGAAGMPLAVFVGGVFREYVNTATDPYGDAAAAVILAGLGPDRPSVEVLTVCLNHPTIPAVDCTECVPLED